jgi:hypothetical protein
VESVYLEERERVGRNATGRGLKGEAGDEDEAG